MVEEQIKKQAEMLCNRISKNEKRLRKWAKREGVSCYRLYDRDIPEIPLVIDWYQGRMHIAEFAKRDVPEMFQGKAWIEKVLQPTAKRLGVSSQNIFYKIRDRQRGQGQYQAKGVEQNRVVVEESGHHFWINLVDYLDTGLFLDHRAMRAMVASESTGKSVLNLYCYTGSFSVYAAKAGAANTLGIDLSGTYLEWARANFELNLLDKERNRLLRGDVMEELAELKYAGQKYDIIVVDPPTFSNSKKLEGVFDVQRDHVSLLRAATSVLAKNGSIYFSTNHRRFHLAPEIEQEWLIRELTAQTLPFDYRDKKIHRSWRMQKRPI